MPARADCLKSTTLRAGAVGKLVDAFDDPQPRRSAGDRFDFRNR
jgi:hypothetical protein